MVATWRYGTFQYRPAYPGQKGNHPCYHHFSHTSDTSTLRKQARRHGALCTSYRHYQVCRKLRRTNLDKAYASLATIYSPYQGRPARPPICMLRSYVAMMECGITSVDVWVSMMHDDSFYAIISGFDPADIPGVGTFYDFQDHLLKRLRQSRTFQRPPFHRRTQRDKAAHHKDKTDIRPHN